MFVMWVTNVILFWRLICSDVLRPRRRHLAQNGTTAAKAGTNGVAASLALSTSGVCCNKSNGILNGSVVANHHDEHLNHVDDPFANNCQNGTTVVNGASPTQLDAMADGFALRQRLGNPTISDSIVVSNGIL
jgi:hypothetical protein